jgi:hypothetical protein
MMRRTGYFKLAACALLLVYVGVWLHLSAFHHHHPEDEHADSCPLLQAALSISGGEMPDAQAPPEMPMFSGVFVVLHGVIFPPASFWASSALRAPPAAAS